MKILRIILYPFSLLYGLIIQLRNLFFDKGIFKVKKIDVPIISIGNIIAGGTGKTPVVEYVVKYLKSLGKHVAVISRGYKRETRGNLIVSDGKNIISDARACGDEPLQIAKKFFDAIVIVDENKYRAACVAKEKFNVDVIVIDDGFQYRWLYRDLDIVIVDSSRRKIDDYLLPTGYLREPISSLKRASFILYNQKNYGNSFKAYSIDIPAERIGYIAKSFVNIINGTKTGLDVFKNKNCTAFCGIGNPEAFKITLENVGLEVKSFLKYPDHHYYNGNEIEYLIERFIKDETDILVTTEKDSVRLLEYKNEFLEIPFYYLEIEVIFLTSEVRFLEIVNKSLKME